MTSSRISLTLTALLLALAAPVRAEVVAPPGSTSDHLGQCLVTLTTWKQAYESAHVTLTPEDQAAYDTVIKAAPVTGDEAFRRAAVEAAVARRDENKAFLDTHGAEKFVDRLTAQVAECRSYTVTR